MLHQLQLTNVGPAPRLVLELGSRLNLITGDNGLGKSFLLDAAWFALTRRWPQQLNPQITSGLIARPIDRRQEATIAFSVDGVTIAEPRHYSSRYVLDDQDWVGPPGRPVNPGMVLYAMADGSFAVWDPARNYWKTRGNRDVQERVSAYVFSPRDIWDGLPNPIYGKGRLCNGLIDDWASWHREDGPAFALLKQVLAGLAPSEQETLMPGPLVRLSLDDSRDFPTIITSYGQHVPVVQASSGVRRILVLAYLLVWTWQEHQRAAELLGQELTPRLIFLIDEVEAHLHPAWQRRVLAALLAVVNQLRAETEVQLLVVTHSPLVMASVEPFFEPATDRWWDLDLIDGAVSLSQRPFERQGDASTWLMSQAFDLPTAGSLDRQQALDRARQLIRQKDEASPAEVMASEQALQHCLSGVDPFWNQWRWAKARFGWQSGPGA
ncbi:AAA family ATPase [Vulcanococcus limneticus]|uniref:AAA family ATPase n=1 Tax=Vulcanococcus limneticus TaxID=2170428 RepID=UPI00398C1BDC